MRRKIRIAELASMASMDPEEAVLRLMDAGFDVSSPDDVISKKKCAQARRAIGFRSSRPDRSIASLAKLAGMDVESARERLCQAGVLMRSTSTIPKRLIHEASRALKVIPETKRIEVPTPVVRAAPEKPARPRKKTRAAKRWPIIGAVVELTHLSAKDIEAIHWKLVEDFARSRDPMSPPGVRDQALLESAVFRAHTSLGEQQKYPTIPMAAAALFHSLVADHPFHNGNKRTALVSLLVFLDKHGYVLTVSDQELFDFVLSAAAHELKPTEDADELSDAEVLTIARWLQSRVRRVSKIEQPLKFRELRRILIGYECTFEEIPGRVIIRRGVRQSHVFYGDEGRDVQTNTIHKIRKDLELDDLHGYDSDIFYNGGARIGEFIDKYRGLLDRLARV